MSGKTCTIPGCDKPLRSLGLCARHRRLDPRSSTLRRYEPDSTCSVEACDGRPVALGMCNNHRRSLLKHGDPTVNKRVGPKIPWEERFWSKVYPCPWTGCWHWGAAIFAARGGYGSFTVKKHLTRKAHVVAYELLVGPVPAGLILDHLCRVTCCVNPEHLEPVTLAENTRRAQSPTMNAWRAGTCLSGRHLMTPDNVYIRPDTGGRTCRRCAAIRSSRQSVRQREARRSRKAQLV